MPIRGPRLVCLLLLVPVPMFAAGNPLDAAKAKPQAQRESNLCWAATSAMIVNAFQDATTPVVTQQELAAYSKAFRAVGIDNLQPGADAGEYLGEWTNSKATAVEDKLNQLFPQSSATAPSTWTKFQQGCAADLENCNAPGIPMFKNLSFDRTADEEALSWCDIVNQIDYQRPILFGLEDIRLGRGRASRHFLVLVGYSSDASGNREVLVWDPWPVDSDGVVPASSLPKHLKSIPYDTYVDPVSHWGVKARHQFDRYNIRNSDPAKPFSSSVPRLAGECGSGNTVAPITLQPQDLDPVIRAFGPDRILETLRGEAKPAPGQKWGVPIPLLGLTEDEILETHGNPERLIVPRVASVIVPVLDARGTVVDVFVAVSDRGKWRRRGYASVGITRMLVETRSSFARSSHLREDALYALAMPFRRTFFVVRGSGSSAQLVPIADDAYLKLKRGRPMSAKGILGCIAGESAPRDPDVAPPVCRYPVAR